MELLRDRRVDGKGFTPRSKKMRGGGPGHAKHWHRGCPNGSPRGKECGAHGFSTEDGENDAYAAMFQSVMESDDNDRFEAVCFLAGGKPNMCDGIPAFSFGAEVDSEEDVVGEYSAYCQPVEASMGGFSLAGGTAQRPPVTGIFEHTHDAAQPLPPAAPLSDGGSVRRLRGRRDLPCGIHR
ncbi:hypothetical protein CYMTET_43670 [Cymbomonas tetramitiformis]|uniref:Uncharacterized protein n=1 Tax=Cymbomonas tetramitiformis TaxID=36881 RepID=A0AAE0F1F1_9CHLO|nr:hypothetical protein CYMTET_43670 [Cymbomonas tetramitiformis]